jgi:hypothetical protein
MIQLGEQPYTHLEFRIQLASRLLDYFSKAKLKSLRIRLGGQRLFGPEL